MLLGDLLSEYAVVWILLYVVCTASSIFWLTSRYQKKMMSGQELAGKIFIIMLLGFPFVAAMLWYIAVSLAY
ncbi:MAG TPA: hypothetical protein DEF45_04810 [Rhodopirellula sp.]|nr:hypothetical protein [Rhodopirellula sp.]